jgi:hypothetical protein
MTLSEIEFKLKEALIFLRSFDATEAVISGRTVYDISSPKKIQIALDILSELPYFEGIVSSLKASDIYVNRSSAIRVSLEDGRFIVSQISSLTQVIEATQVILNSVLPTLPENVIFIKIADPHDLSSLQKNIHPFHQILSQTIIHESIGGKIEFAGVEPGSTWLKIIVGTQAAVNVIAAIAWAGAVCSKKFKEIEYTEQLIVEKKIQNEQKKTLLAAHDIMLNLMIDAEANNIYNSYYANDGKIDPEQISRIRTSIKFMSEEINKGARVVPELTAPEDVKNLFPDFKALPMIESKIGKLENKNNP